MFYLILFLASRLSGPLCRNSHNARSNYSRGTRLFVSDLVSRREDRWICAWALGASSSRRCRDSRRRRACIRRHRRRRRRRWSSHRRGTRFPKRVRDRRWPDLARRAARQSGVPFQPYRTQTIYDFSTRFRYQVPRFINDDRTAKCVSHRTRLIGITLGRKY